MSSSFTSLSLPSSHLPHSSIPFTLPRNLFFFSHHNTNQQGKLNSSVPLSTFIRNSSETKISNISSFVDENSTIRPKKVSELIIKEEYKLDYYRGSSRLQVQDLVERIKSLPPASQRTKIIEIVRKDGKFKTILEFNDLLMALFIADETKLALELYSNSSSSYGLVPDCWTYSIILRCYCKVNEPIEAKQVLELMIENGFQPNVKTFTILISSLCKGGRLKKAFEVFRSMNHIGCEPTIQTYNCLLKGLCYVGKVEEAYEYLMNIKKSSKKPDIYTYTAVMDGFCKVGRSNEALELLEEALEMGLKPNVITFNTLLTGFFKEGRPLEGVNLLNQMKETNCDPDYISYSTLLHGLLKWGEIQEALGIYKEMVEKGFEVDERMVNTLLRGLCRRSRREKGLLKDAYEVFEEMNERVLVIYPNTYGLVIEAFCIGHEVDKGVHNLREMVGAGYAPRNITYNYVIQALCVEAKVDEALSVLILMCEGHRLPSRISFNSLIDGFNRQDRFLSACSVYGAALKQGVVPEKQPRGCSDDIRGLILI